MRLLIISIIINSFISYSFSQTFIGNNGKISTGPPPPLEIWELSDEIICDKAPHIDAYPELKPFHDEAVKRNLSCSQISIKNIPKNAHQTYGDTWSCNDGYKQEYNSNLKLYSCVKVKVPENATVFGAQWICNKGYIEKNNSCVRPNAIPENAYSVENSWKCKSGYFKYGSACLRIPNNAYAYGDSWKCKSGFEREGNYCKKKITIPPNAYASGDSWKCKSGYQQSGNTCKKKAEPQQQIQSGEVLKASSGSGFVISSDGHLATNNHVVEHCTEVKIHKDGDVYKGKVIATDRQNDLAIVKSNFKPNVILPLSKESGYLGQDIFVAGFPFGKSISSSVVLTNGIISSKTGINNNYSNMQITAALQPGNSGGPIIDKEYGNVVGVAVGKLAIEKIYEDFGVFPENTNFGIKSSVLEIMLNANNINPSKPNLSKIETKDLSYNIEQATLYLSCWMTLAQIKKFSTKKVMFRDLVN